MGMKFAPDVDEFLMGVLTKGIIQIMDIIDEDTADYVQRAVLIARAAGSPPLKVLLNSGGGDLYASFFIHDVLSSYEGGTTAIVMGRAMSGANLILQGCKTRLSTYGSTLFVHEMISHDKLNILRNKKKFQEYLDDLIHWQNKLYTVYQKRTGKSRAELRRIFEKEKVLSPEHALAYNFIDQIVDPADLKLTSGGSKEIELTPEQLEVLMGSATK